MTTPTEAIYYQDAHVLITNARAVIFQKTYTLRNVSSVTTVTLAGDMTIPVLICLAGLTLLAVLFFVNIFIALPVGILVGGFGLWKGMQVKNRYAVRITSTSGESNAIVSTSHPYIQQIVVALNQAIAAQYP